MKHNNSEDSFNLDELKDSDETKENNNEGLKKILKNDSDFNNLKLLNHLNKDNDDPSSTLIEDVVKVNSTDLNALQDFLINKMGDLHFLERIRDLKHSKYLKDSDISIESIDLIENFIIGTKDIRKFEAAYLILDEMSQNIITDQITKEELEVIHKFTKLVPVLKNMKQQYPELLNRDDLIKFSNKITGLNAKLGQVLNKEDENIRIRASKETILNLVNIELDLYKERIKQKTPEALNDLKVSLIARLSEVIKKEFNVKSMVLDESSINFIERHVDELVRNVERIDSKNFIQRWVENIVNYIRGKEKSIDSYNVEKESVKITKRLEGLVISNKDNIPIIWTQDEIKRGKLVLTEMRKYDLLDNLSDYKKIQALSDGELKILYQLAMVEPLINCYVDSKYSINGFYKKFEKSRLENKPISRKEMLEDIQAVLREKDNQSLPSIEEINMIKSNKSNRDFQMMDDNYKEAYRRGNLDSNFAQELNSVKESIKELQDHYILKEVVSSVVSKINHKEDKFFLINMYKKIGVIDPLQELEKELLSQCKKDKHLADQLNTSDKVNAFKDRLLKQLETDKRLGHVKEAAKELTISSNKAAGFINRIEKERQSRVLIKNPRM